MPESEQKFLRPANVAPLLGVGVGRVYQLVAAGGIPAVRRGRTILIPRAAWESWLAAQAKVALKSVAQCAPRNPA